MRRGMHSISYSPCQCQACLLGAEVGDADKTGIFIGSSVTRSWPDVEVVVIPVLADSLEKSSLHALECQLIMESRILIESLV